MSRRVTGGSQEGHRRVLGGSQEGHRRVLVAPREQLFLSHDATRRVLGESQEKFEALLSEDGSFSLEGLRGLLELPRRVRI